MATKTLHTLAISAWKMTSRRQKSEMTKKKMRITPCSSRGNMPGMADAASAEITATMTAKSNLPVVRKRRRIRNATTIMKRRGTNASVRGRRKVAVLRNASLSAVKIARVPQTSLSVKVILPSIMSRGQMIAVAGEAARCEMVKKKMKVMRALDPTCST